MPDNLINLTWDAYYRETDAVSRREILQALLAGAYTDRLDALRKALFDARYEEMKRAPYLADRFLAVVMEFLQYGRTGRINSARTRSEVLKTLEKLRGDLAEPYGTDGEEVLLEEYRHVVRVYYECADRGGYRTFFGLMQGSDDYRHRRMLEDAVGMSRFLAVRCGLEEEMALWNRAVRDVYGSFGRNYTLEFDGYPV